MAAQSGNSYVSLPELVLYGTEARRLQLKRELA